MAHSHHHHREHQVSHRRVHKILEEHGSDAKHHHSGPHSHAFSKVTSKTAAENHDKYACGGSAPKRYARGGKVKHGKSGHQTNIAIITPHHPAGGPSTPPIAAGPTGGPPLGGPPPLPMGAGPGGPPMMPPPGGPPGMPRARGGRIGKKGGGPIDGESTREDIKKWEKRDKANSYARGGGLPTAGAATGVGRLESAEMMKRHKK